MSDSSEGALTNERLLSPPSPTHKHTAPSVAQGSSVQALTLRFAAGPRPADRKAGSCTRPSERSSPLDLSAFAPARTSSPVRWCHSTRHLDPQARLRLRELVDLAVPEDPSL